MEATPKFELDQKVALADGSQSGHGRVSGISPLDKEDGTREFRYMVDPRGSDGPDSRITGMFEESRLQAAE